jgi:penicillin amidase
LLLTACGAAVVLAWRLEARVDGALPPLDGTLYVAGLSAPVRIERDDLGVPTLRADNRTDLAFATGFVHGQDRFFQMDMLRRHPAGELAALFGRQALPEDRKLRMHRFRALARKRLKTLPAADRALLEAYTAGVEAGRRSADRPPFEYMLLGGEPAPWRAEDTLLVALGMFRLLQWRIVEQEQATALLYDRLPRQLADFLCPLGSSWDAPLDGQVLGGLAVPGPDVLDLRKHPAGFDPLPVPPAAAGGSTAWLGGGGPRYGSNNWAVAGRHTTHGGAIVANDMHLWLTVPGVWYRARFIWRGPDGRSHRITGVTLPGIPAMTVGSNTHIAWGFTNLEGDFADLVLLEQVGEDPDVYRTMDGTRRLERYTEVIGVAGGRPETVEVAWSVWGPVLDRDHRGRQRVLRWVGHDPESLNLEGMRLESARTLAEALDLANRAGQPAQNFVVADARGRIAWTVVGRIPRRVGFDGRTPTSWADGTRRWDGWLAPHEYPRVVRPREGKLWTANNRVIGEPYLSRLGLGTYDIGARARQIRDGLRTDRKLNEADMLAIQLDDRAVFLERWQRLLLEVLRPSADPERQALRRVVYYWGGRASPDSIGFRVVRNFRAHTHGLVLGALTVPCRRADARFQIGWLGPDIEAAVWRLVRERPPHLLPQPYASWDDLLQDAVNGVRRDITTNGKVPLLEALPDYTWGDANTVYVEHPFSSLSSRLQSWLRLNMRVEEMSGDAQNMPRIQSQTEGASQRMAVSPGREEEGYFHMPAGQSGHPRSPYYRKGHEAWAQGRGTPFLPGAVKHTLVLEPAP